MFGKWRRQRQSNDVWDKPPASDEASSPPSDATAEQPRQGLTMPVPPSPAGWTDQLTVEQIAALAAQTMWARDAIRWMLHQVAAHRWDGHDCPVYCIPMTMEHYLMRCTTDDLRLILATIIKDSVHLGSDADFEDIEDEP